MSYAVKRQYPASEGATQPRNKGARLERMNLQVQTKTQSRFSATPATPETLGALRPAGRLAIQCRKMEREEPKRKGSSDPLKELLPTQEPVAGGSFRHWHLGGVNVRQKRIVQV
jgi:hypothetical protein